MNIVPAQPADLPALLRLFASCADGMQKNGIDQWDHSYPNEDVVARDVNGCSSYLARDDSGRLVATICLNREQHPTYQTVHWIGREPVLAVHRLCVDPVRQKDGIGSRLMEFAEQYAAQSGYSSIRLDTYSGNPVALRFYERRGYRRAGQVFFNRRPEPFICFEKIL